MIQELIWDTEFFGKKIGKIDTISPDENFLNRLIEQAIQQQFRYLTCRVTADKIFTVQVLEKYSFYLIDMGIVFERSVGVIDEPKLYARTATVGDIETIKNIAVGLFKSGRFYQDHFFTQEEADKFYQTWAENSVRGFADKVFLIKDEGFVTCKVLDNTGEIPLIGVSISSQGKGIGAALILNALKWFKDRKVNNVTVRTQAGNIEAIRFYENLGFKIKTLDITMGKILDSKKIED